MATPSPARSLEADYTAWGHSSVVKYVELLTILRVPVSVVDLVSDPYVFGPPGSGSAIICSDPDPNPPIFHNQARKVRKTLVSTVCDFFLLFIFEE